MQTNKPHQLQQNAYTKIQDSKVEHACTGWFPMENSTLPKLSTLPLENSHTLETLSHKLAAILEFLIKTNQNQNALESGNAISLSLESYCKMSPSYILVNWS